MSSSGAPRKIEGMKSTNVWVIAIAVMKISRIVIGRFVINGRDSADMATRFMWIPGISPVNVPVRMPSRSGTIRWNMLFYLLLSSKVYIYFILWLKMVLKGGVIKYEYGWNNRLGC